MKRQLLIVILLLQLIILASCSDDRKNDINKSSSEESYKAADNMESSTYSGENKALSDFVNKKQNTLSRFEIIAESGTSISSVDKEKVLKKLDVELGDLFDSISSLEEK